MILVINNGFTRRQGLENNADNKKYNGSKYIE